MRTHIGPPIKRIPASYIELINQIFEIERKTKSEHKIERNIHKIKDLIQNELFRTNDIIGFRYHDPIKEKYDITRTDCIATIIGESTDNLVIIETIKPMIFLISGPTYSELIVQPAVVVAQSAQS